MKQDYIPLGDNSGLILNCDTTLKDFMEVINLTYDQKEVLGYKIGSKLINEIGFINLNKYIYNLVNKYIIYDCIEAGNTNSYISKGIFDNIINSNIDSIVISPRSGPKYYLEWLNLLLSQNIHIIINGLPNIKNYLVSDGGYISDSSIIDIYMQAASKNIFDFLFTAEKPNSLNYIINIIKTIYSNNLNIHITDLDLSLLSHSINNPIKYYWISKELDSECNKLLLIEKWIQSYKLLQQN